LGSVGQRKVVVRVIRNHGQRRWLVDLRIRGVRHRRFFSTKESAQEFIAQHAKEREHYGALLAELSTSERVRLIDALERLKTIGVTLEAAVAAAESQAAARPGREPVRADAAAAAMMDAKKAAGRRGRYLRQMRYSLRKFLSIFGAQRVDLISVGEIEAWLARSKWAPATRRSVIIDLRTFFSFCQRRGWVQVSPTDGLERPCLEQKPPCIFSPDEARRTMEVALEKEPVTVPVFALGLFAGLRPAEIERLRWSEIGAQYVEVTAAKSKTRQRRLVTITPTLSAWLGTVPRGDDLVLPTNWVRRWRRVVRLAGVKWGHDILRHSFASYHLAQGRNANATAFELGHRNAEMLFAHYREVVTAEQAATFWGLRPAAPGQTT
jgi:integrase